MTSFSANVPDSSSQSLSVVLVTYPGMKLLDLAGPLQVFTDARRGPGNLPAYGPVVASLHGGSVSTDTCVEISTVPLVALRRRSVDTLLVVGGGPAEQAASDDELVSHVRKLASKARRKGAICTGAFVAGAAGWLDGKRAVTHWDSCAALAAAHPATRVDPDPIFVKDDDVWTSAGVTAGLDLALAMVAEDLGRAAAMELARKFVAYMVRPGGQVQFSDVLAAQLSDTEGRFDKLHHWIGNNLSRELRVETLAKKANMSPRNFARLYAEHVGKTPAKAIECLRVEAACQMLTGGSRNAAAIAKRCGFSNQDQMRRAFNRTLKVSPDDYRKRFGGDNS